MIHTKIQINKLIYKVIILKHKKKFKYKYLHLYNKENKKNKENKRKKLLKK